MSGGLGPVEIGAQQIYDRLLDVSRAVDKIDGKLDRHGDRLDDHEERLGDHEARLRTVEGRRFASPAQIVTWFLAFLALAASAIGLFLS